MGNSSRREAVPEHGWSKPCPFQEYPGWPDSRCSSNHAHRMLLSRFNDRQLLKGAVLLYLSSKFLPSSILQLCGHKVDQFSCLANGKSIIFWGVIFPPDRSAEQSLMVTRSHGRVAKGVIHPRIAGGITVSQQPVVRPVLLEGQAAAAFRWQIIQCHTDAGGGHSVSRHPDTGWAHLPSFYSE